MPLDAPTITVALPVYRGTNYVAATLRSIKAQSFTAYRLLISVDGGDAESAEACAPFLNDARIDLVVQSEQLGWAGNLNTLIARCQTRYFCFWQQDDQADASYLEQLSSYLDANPHVACAYADVQWFGARTERDSLPNVEGLSFPRAIALMRSGSYLPFLGLMRSSLLKQVGCLRTDHELSSLEDLIHGVKLALVGELHRVPGTLYFKRAHEGATHRVWMEWPPERRREAWVKHGTGLLEALLPAANAGDRPRLLATVFDRLIGADGSWPLYAASGGDIAILADVIEECAASAELGRSVTALMNLFTSAGATGLQRAFPICHRAFSLVRTRRELTRVEMTGESVALEFSHGADGCALLGEGWSTPESWGTWSDGQRAVVHLPFPAGPTAWLLEVRCRPYPPAERSVARRVTIAVGGQIVEPWEFVGADATAREFRLPHVGGRDGAMIVCIDDPTVPADLGDSTDRRQLGFGLIGVTLRAWS